MSTAFSTRLRALGIPAEIVVLPIDDYLDELFVEERQLVARAVKKRRHEFSTGRVCARRALVNLGVQPQRILAGRTREPVWPAQVVGSITHDGNIGIAAVQWASRLAGIGVDVADCAVPSAELGRYVCTSRDAPALRALAHSFPDVSPASAIFSIKEAAFKCLFPSVTRIIDFAEVAVRTRVERDSIGVSLDGEGDLQPLAQSAVGALIRFDRYFFSAVWIRNASVNSRSLTTQASAESETTAQAQTLEIGHGGESS
jgi:4'-phosphopantetheinyl transferase EntD